MSEIDAKVNMSLDEIIKMENKKKRQKDKMKGAKNIRGGSNVRGKGGLRGRGIARTKQNFISAKKGMQTWKRQGKLRGGFIKKRYNKNNTLSKSRSNLTLNRNMQKSNRGGLTTKTLRGKIGLTRSRSRSNLTFTQSGLFTGNKTLRKRTSSMPNLRDPTSVHNRLGYQSPAQIAYRNRVKRAKQLLLQRQNQRLNLHNNFRVNQPTKPLTTLQRALELRQQALMSQRRFTGGMRSDFILRAQRRAQYEEKLLRMNANQMNINNEVNFMCTLDPLRQRPLSLTQNPSSSNVRQLARGRSPFRQSLQNINMVGRTQSFGRQRRSRSRSRSRSRNRNIVVTNTDMDDRTFSEVMYSVSGGVGVTDKTLNERFSY